MRPRRILTRPRLLALTAASTLLVTPAAVLPASAATTPSMTLVTEIPIRNYPQRIYGVNEKTHRVYVPKIGGTVSVIDGKTNTEIANISIPTRYPGWSVVNEKTNRVYVTGILGVVFVIDGNTNTVIDSFPTGSGAPQPAGCLPFVHPTACATIGAESIDGLAISTKLNRLYVTNLHDGTVSVFDLATNRRNTDINTGSGPSLPPNCDEDDEDPASPDFCTTQGANPIAVAIDDRHGLVYVSHYRDNTVAIINARTNRVVNTIPVPPEPTAIAYSDRADRLFVTSQETNTMTVIDGKTAREKHVVAILTVGLVSKESAGTEGIAVNDKTATIYVCNQSDGKVFAFDRDTLKPLGDPITIPFAYGLGLDVSTNRVYAGTAASIAANPANLVAVIDGVPAR